MTTETLASSIETEVKTDTFTSKLPPRLRNAELALNAIESFGFVPENVELYMRVNAWTQAAEATTKGVVMNTYQAFDENTGLVGYGFPTVAIYAKGLKDIDRLREVHGSDIEFEEERRIVELWDAGLLNERIKSGELKNNIKITISPTPENVNPDVAKEIGYFVDKKIAMIRILEYEEETAILKTTQIPVEHSDSRIFSSLIALCEGDESIKSLSCTEILGRQILLPKGKIRSSIDIARIYDRMLDTEKGGRHFLGEEISEGKRDYQSIIAHSKEVEQITEPITNELVKTDIELGKSLHLGYATETIRSAIVQALQAVDNNSNPILDYDSRTLLLNSLTGRFTVKSAEVVNNFVTKNLYTKMLCVVNPERAKEFFAADEVNDLKNSYEANPLNTITQQPPLNPVRDLELLFCGDLLRISSASQMFSMSPGQFNSFLREAESILCCTCPFCGNQVEAKISNGRITCPRKECGKSAPYKKPVSSIFSLN